MYDSITSARLVVFFSPTDYMEPTFTRCPATGRKEVSKRSKWSCRSLPH